MRAGLLGLCMALSVAASSSAVAQYRAYPPSPYPPEPYYLDDEDYPAGPRVYVPPNRRPPAVVYEDAPYQRGSVPRPPEDVRPGWQQRQAAPQPGFLPRPAPPGAVASLPQEYQAEQGETKELPAHLRRQLVSYPTREPAGTLVIDTANTYLYLVLGDGRALRYGIGVGREGFTWTGAERVSKMAEWPDWHPPAEMIERQPFLPRFMSGGEGNPLGARALYLGKTLYRIHGTNQPSTIGTFVSSGCIRLTNEDIMDLYNRVQVGSRVVVLPGDAAASRQPPAAAMREPGRPDWRVR